LIQVGRTTGRFFAEWWRALKDPPTRVLAAFVGGSFRARDHWRFFIAPYGWLAFDTVTGEGDDRNSEDLTQQGPTIGAGFKF